MTKTSLLYLVIFISALTILLFTQQSCIKEYADMDKISKTVDYSPSVAAAIAETKLTLQDIIKDYDEDELFTEDGSGFLYLMYDKEVFTERADEFIFMPDMNFGPMDQYNDLVYNTLATTEGSYKRFPQVEIPYSFLIDNNNSSEKLDSIVFDILDLDIDVSSSFHGDGVLDIEFPMLRKSNGDIFTTTIILNGTGSAQVEENHHLEDCKLVMDQSTSASDNQILFKLDLKIIDGITPNSGDNVSINIELKNMDFHLIHGYVGEMSLNVDPDTIQLSIFDNAFSGFVYFADPSLTMHIDNALGLPIRIYYDSLHTYSVISNSVEVYPFPGDDSLNINAPVSIGQIAHTDVVIDVNTFPEIRDLIYNQPKYLSFEVNARTNPEGIIDDAHPNFILDTSKVSVDLEVKLPLWGNALYSLVDTVELNMEENFDDISDHFVEANIRTIFDNFLPTDVYAQVIFVDSLYQPIDTLYSNTVDNIGERLIESAVVNGEGRAVQSTKKISDILFGNGPSYDHDINALKEVHYAIVIATLKTNEDGAVGPSPASMSRFYADNYLMVKFGLKGKGKYEETIE